MNKMATIIENNKHKCFEELSNEANIRFKQAAKHSKISNNKETPNWYKVNEIIFKKMRILLI